MTKPKITLTIAGNDASGGAGIAADLKTFAEYGTFGIAALTVIATMDPNNNWSHGITPINPKVVKDQLVTATAGSGIDAFKTGMLPNVDIITVIADHIKEHQMTNFVADPVMVCKGVDEVLNPENAEALKDVLVPLATVATPNLFEAAQLAGLKTLTSVEDMKEAARIIHDNGAKTVVIKGGKALPGTKAIDLFFDGEEFTLFETHKIDAPSNHGAGCTFAAAITAGLAYGLTPKEAVAKAKEFVTAAIKTGFPFNQFISPVFHSGYRLSHHKAIIE